MGDCNRAEERRDQAGVTHVRVLPGACSQTLQTPRPLQGGKEAGARGGCNTEATGANFIHPLGTFSLETIPGVPSPWHGSPGMRDLAWDGDEGHEPGSLQPLRYQIRPPPSLLHAVLARPK